MWVLTIGNQRDHIGRTFNEFAHHCGKHRIGHHHRGQLGCWCSSGNNYVSSVSSGVAGRCVVVRARQPERSQ